MARIGPKFSEDIRAAGLAGLPFAWTEDGITYGSTLTPEQRAAIEAVLASHNPQAPATDRDDVRDAYVAAKNALETFAANSTLANAKPALLKLGLCVEELLKYLNKRIA
jgi:hypothetical protein